MANNNNRIDPTPVRISNNLTIERQTPKRDFGDRLKSGLDTAAGAIANGASIAGGLIPGGAIVSTAVSSMTQFSNSSPSAGAAYAANGVINVNGGGAGLSTTIGAPSTTVSGGSIAGGISNTPNYQAGTGSSSTIAGMNSDVVAMQRDQNEMLKLQVAMQRENTMFSSISNVLKTRHDTTKNSISNIR
ncbi:MAG: hypothetical protein K1X64_09815 [Myxococcaceae bacterium]|nr:hypothetical protein [Myxococcaceae bacterium]